MLVGQLTAYGQLFNFSMQTNNQQIVDVALRGSFYKISQGYELCDTVRKARFGRNGKEFFSIVPFIGVCTVKGLLYPSVAETPWKMDDDFKKYETTYRPEVTKTSISQLNTESDVSVIHGNLSGVNVSKILSIMEDSLYSKGLMIDTLPGKKEGWAIWLSSVENLSNTDSVKITSVYKSVSVVRDSTLEIKAPDLSGAIWGGIYVTPYQSGIGQVSFVLTGVVVKNNEKWELVFPFIQEDKKKEILTPIGSDLPMNSFNQLKRKQK
jgi:hypothetical protein